MHQTNNLKNSVWLGESILKMLEMKWKWNETKILNSINTKPGETLNLPVKWYICTMYLTQCSKTYIDKENKKLFQWPENVSCQPICSVCKQSSICMNVNGETHAISNNKCKTPAKWISDPYLSMQPGGRPGRARRKQACEDQCSTNHIRPHEWQSILSLKLPFSHVVIFG